MKQPEHNKLQLFTAEELAKPPFSIASRSTIWRWVKMGAFPKPIKCGRFRKWLLCDIEQWLLEQRKQALQGE
ncbi:AlpA family phage regulatory protein [Pasteurella skyensis]|uniref:AlpA family phage regulatory protein n=1 Tax=Phocoenobacter skyensis TaxID=97481 RepID=A0AAJ6P2E8_9PAST|nr:AlpA family phage regulatory protein [Pasteurella skyensis]MDP8170555.1 AlpA family phage regulatory protein [Pasteurella skyensis]MDP8174618.1 AlpA family phage regulatory protein [Pasteurella skyensis]